MGGSVNNVNNSSNDNVNSRGITSQRTRSTTRREEDENDVSTIARIEELQVAMIILRSELDLTKAERAMSSSTSNSVPAQTTEALPCLTVEGPRSIRLI